MPTFFRLPHPLGTGRKREIREASLEHQLIQDFVLQMEGCSSCASDLQGVCSCWCYSHVSHFMEKIDITVCVIVCVCARVCLIVKKSFWPI